jgi:hypothetical protein
MSAGDLAPGTAVRIEILCERPRIGATRVNVRRMLGVVLGPVTYEPGMLRVRVNGRAVRLLREYLTPDSATREQVTS